MILSILTATIIITSSLDFSSQPALFYSPSVTSPIPLLVVLHSWGGDYQQETSQIYTQWCIENNWAFIHPNFRGPNNNPSSTGSDLAVQDVVDAVHYAKNNSNIDPQKIYLLGGSGGGHLGLLVISKHPELFTHASIWVPIVDLTSWYYQTTNTVYSNYARNIINSTGGIPGQSLEIDNEYFNRSPLIFLTSTLTTTISLNVGIFDGHTGSVPVSHSLLAFNKMVSEPSRFSDSEISYITINSKIPSNLVGDIYCNNHLMTLLTRTSGKITLNIFNGTHEVITDYALNWLKRRSLEEEEVLGECNKFYNPIILK